MWCGVLDSVLYVSLCPVSIFFNLNFQHIVKYSNNNNNNYYYYYYYY
jgi:hypothetical protein